MKQGTPCPNDEILVDFLENRLSDKQRSTVEAHLAVCAACREQVAVCSDVMEDAAMTEPVAAPQALTQKTLGRVAEAASPRKSRDVFTRARHWMARGLEQVERLTLGSRGTPVPVRGGTAESALQVVRREKSFGDVTFGIELEKSGDFRVTIRVFPRVSTDHPLTASDRLRVTLCQNDRELASETVGQYPLVFEDIRFGVYSLVFTRNGEKLGEYLFQISKPEQGE